MYTPFSFKSEGLAPFPRNNNSCKLLWDPIPSINSTTSRFRPILNPTISTNTRRRALLTQFIQQISSPRMPPPHPKQERIQYREIQRQSLHFDSLGSVRTVLRSPPPRLKLLVVEMRLRLCSPTYPTADEMTSGILY